MINFAIKYQHVLIKLLLEHMELVFISLIISIVLAFILTIISRYFNRLSNILIYIFSLIYSIPSLVLFATLIPLLGLGKLNAIIVLVLYSQYILLRNFIEGINAIDKSIIESAVAMGMSVLQIFLKVQLPLSLPSFIAGIKLAVISTVGIATIAVFINAGGLGALLFDGLRTMNMYKILWGSILSAVLVLSLNVALSRLERYSHPYAKDNKS